MSLRQMPTTFKTQTEEAVYLLNGIEVLLDEELTYTFGRPIYRLTGVGTTCVELNDPNGESQNFIEVNIPEVVRDKVELVELFDMSFYSEYGVYVKPNYVHQIHKGVTLVKPVGRNATGGRVWSF
jgi:hypothetical protein